MSAASAGESRASIADLRKEYSMNGLEEKEVPFEPFGLFKQWLSDAMAAKV
jgi:pyridoxine/pyridoxamine 5'-phosphate oxidase